MPRDMIILVSMFYLAAAPLSAWEDKPDQEDHKQTDRLFKACQRLTKANKYEIKLIEKKAKEERDRQFSKLKRKVKEKTHEEDDDA